jgi:hypothetical protein
MKNIVFTLLFVYLLNLGCAPKLRSACVVGQEYQGEGLKSELLSVKNRVIEDTTLSFLNVNVSIGNEFNGKLNKEIGSGITIRITKTGHKKLEIGGIANQKGDFNTFLEKGKYDIEFLFTGCNPLLVRNFEIHAGEKKFVEVLLGRKGKRTLEK